MMLSFVGPDRRKATRPSYRKLLRTFCREDICVRVCRPAQSSLSLRARDKNSRRREFPRLLRIRNVRSPLVRLTWVRRSTRECSPGHHFTMEVSKKRVDSPATAECTAGGNPPGITCYRSAISQKSNARRSCRRDALEIDGCRAGLSRREQYERRRFGNFASGHCGATGVDFGINAIADRRCCVPQFRGSALIESRLKTAPS